MQNCPIKTPFLTDEEGCVGKNLSSTCVGPRDDSVESIVGDDVGSKVELDVVGVSVVGVFEGLELGCDGAMPPSSLPLPPLLVVGVPTGNFVGLNESLAD